VNGTGIARHNTTASQHMAGNVVKKVASAQLDFEATEINKKTKIKKPSALTSDQVCFL
jgi:hypothetical protein